MSLTIKIYVYFFLILGQTQGFLIRHLTTRIDTSPSVLERGTTGTDFHRLDTKLQSSTPQKPLYDVTNYTFPDTTTPGGIAEVLEVTFIHGIMQLRNGYVDVIKLFIATAMSSYQFGFSIDAIQTALKECPNETANRPLLPEEVELRKTWLCVVYLTLLSIDHKTVNRDAIMSSIPTSIQEMYGMVINKMVSIQTQDTMATITVEDVMKYTNTDDLGLMERALFTQSLRVAALTMVVVREALEASPDGQSVPPTPPIEGAFE